MLARFLCLSHVLLSFFFSPLSRTIEPGGQVLALHAVVLKAQVPQNDWLRPQEVVERCGVQLLICRDKIYELKFNSVYYFFSLGRALSLSALTMRGQ